MTIICSHCNHVISFSPKQLGRAKEALARLPQGKILRFKCPACKKLLELKSEMLPPRAPPGTLPASHKTSGAAAEDRRSTGTKNTGETKTYEFKTIYLPVDSVHDGVKLVKSFDISSLQILGDSGWDVVTAIPRTFSQTFSTEIDTAFAKKNAVSAACGGNVMGVHLILKRIRG